MVQWSATSKSERMWSDVLGCVLTRLSDKKHTRRPLFCIIQSNVFMMLLKSEDEVADLDSETVPAPKPCSYSTLIPIAHLFVHAPPLSIDHASFVLREFLQGSLES